MLYRYTGLDRELKAHSRKAQGQQGGGAEEDAEDPPDPYTEQIRYVLCPTVVAIVEGLMMLGQLKFEKALKRVFALLCALIECNDAKVRMLVTTLFLNKIGPALGLPAPPSSDRA